MSRNFTADQILTERLVINDTKAFEELYHRYWYSLYFYGLRKLQCKEESKQLVQSVFVDLWHIRHSLTASFNLAQHLYEEGKRDVSNRLDQKVVSIDMQSDDTLVMENVESLQQMHSDAVDVAARKLVRYVSSPTTITGNNQVKNWSSVTKLNTYMTCKEKDLLEQEILEEIQTHTAYLLFFPKKEVPWWQKIAAMF